MKVDYLKIFGSLLFAVVGFFGFYFLGSYNNFIRWGALFIGLLLSLVLFLFSISGRAFVVFGREAWLELKKVVWPTRKESVYVTLYVFLFIFVVTLFLWLTDKALEWFMYDLILGWRRG